MSEPTRSNAIIPRTSWQRRALVCLGIGVMLNVLVSWSIALWRPDVLRDIVAHRTDRRLVLDGLVFHEFSAGSSIGLASRVWKTVQRADEIDSGAAVDYTMVFEHTTGFPFPNMRSRIIGVPWPSAKWRAQGVVLPDAWPLDQLRFHQTAFGQSMAYRPLPIRPVLQWFVPSVLLWAGVVAAIWFIAMRVLATSRRSRGRCVGCAYELRGLQACPECGVPASTALPLVGTISPPTAGNALIGGTP